ncbi:AAA family ATPase [Enemella evansiae]|uniref:AAA family ATPase n=1 Tax=Enemella evansiae TaxID=2016499 RepID=UPI000B963631|nr:AAA family ATPase [Enemella evansiae]OYO01220.1 AAA family ATPase [Enemella evansiae]
MPSQNYGNPPRIDGPMFPEHGPPATAIGEPLDWSALWSSELAAVDWIVEPLIAAGRLVSLYSPPKAGKSLLALEISAALAAGRPVLDQSVAPRKVLYVDFENDPRGDVIQRLKAFGYEPGDLGNLHYYSFPRLAGLDTPAGGAELLRVAQLHQVDLVVIDTVSRTVNGEENDNDTWLLFYRCTGLLLKRAGIACLRLDHSGKDASKGQRGGSAKAGDVDATWRLSTVSEDTYRLDCESSRQVITDRVLVLHRLSNPLRHERSSIPGLGSFEAKVREAEKLLDEWGCPPDANRATTRNYFREAGRGMSNQVLAEVVKRRKAVRNDSGQPAIPDLSESGTDSGGQDNGDGS